MEVQDALKKELARNYSSKTDDVIAEDEEELVTTIILSNLLFVVCFTVVLTWNLIFLLILVIFYFEFLLSCFSNHLIKLQVVEDYESDDGDNDFAKKDKFLNDECDEEENDYSLRVSLKLYLIVSQILQ